MNATTKHRCALVAAREPLVRFGIRKLLESQACVKVIAEAPSLSEATAMVEKFKPDLLVLDLSTFEGGLHALRQLMFRRPDTRTIAIVRSAENSRTSKALASGASGVIAKGSPTRILLDCVGAVLAGQDWSDKELLRPVPDKKLDFPVTAHRNRRPNDYGLTPRELDVIGTIVDGYSNKDVGKRFSITERTVKHHLSNIYQKLEVSSRLELAIFALSHGLGRRQGKLPSSAQAMRETQRLDEEHHVTPGMNERAS
jgi:two-component system nitrate/nitrite response regulator NarL